jgi:hypothetical protein
MSISNATAFPVHINKSTGDVDVRQEPEKRQMGMELPGKLPVHETSACHKKGREGLMVVAKGRRRMPELRVQRHTFPHLATACERKHSSVIGGEVTVWHGSEEVRRRGREGEVGVPSEHGVVGVDGGLGHSSEQATGVARAAEEQMQRQELVSERGGRSDEMLEAGEADVEEKAAGQCGERRCGAAEQEEAGERAEEREGRAQAGAGEGGQEGDGGGGLAS